MSLEGPSNGRDPWGRERDDPMYGRPPESSETSTPSSTATPFPYDGDLWTEQHPSPATDAGALGDLSHYGGPYRPNFGSAPAFSFQAPSLQQAASEPGYQFARDEGQRALQQSQAGKGALRTGGSLKDLLSWGDKFATQNYGNVYDRAFREAQAQYEPRLRDWEAQNRAAELEWQRYYDEWTYNNPSASAIFTAGAGM